jgi:hypothetical protein
MTAYGVEIKTVQIIAQCFQKKRNWQCQVLE